MFISYIISGGPTLEYRGARSLYESWLISRRTFEQINPTRPVSYIVRLVWEELEVLWELFVCSKIRCFKRTWRVIKKKCHQLTEEPNTNFDEHLISFISNRYQISEMVLSLRRQRNCGTVQTSKQYEFIYNALKDEIINPVPKEDIKTFLRPPLSSPTRPSPESVRSPRNSREVRGRHGTCRSEVGQVGHLSLEHFNAQHN